MKMIAECRWQYCILNMGEGFQEKDRLLAAYDIDGQEYSFEFAIPEGVRAIRFGTCEYGETMLYFTDLVINGKAH